jgi:ABC-type Mn2+/Zn2+ transport system ATPase subunit
MTSAVAGSLVALDRVTCRYNTEPVLVNVSLAVDAGSFIGVVGPSGSGKTTVLRAILGTVPLVAGRVDRRRGLTVGYVPQVETVDWNFPVTVGQCVLMAKPRSRLLPWASAEEKNEVARVLDALGIADLESRHIRELSGGQQQRVFLARALIGRPDLLLLDEPTSGVDVRTRHEVLHLLRDLNAEGIAVLLTTHDLNGIAAHLPEIVCLNREVIAAGKPSEILRPEVLERTYGARMEVLEHGGMPVVVDDWSEPRDTGTRGRIVPFRRTGSDQ